MRVYIPFDDGSSVSFDGQEFKIYMKPKDIDYPDSQDVNKPCKAEIAWTSRWSEIIRALETAYKRQEKAKKEQNSKKIYKP